MECAARVEAHVRELAGAIGERNVFRPQALRAADDYIQQTWRGQGYAVTAQAYDAYGVRCANLEAVRRGSAKPQEILLIGAHYDTVRGCPGANDNGSGVAAMLEISRWFAELAPALTVRFVAFVNEEPPSFSTGQQGSAVYASAARQRGDDIRLMVSLETIGCYSDAPGSQRYPPLFRHFFPDRGNFLGLVSDFRSAGALRRTARAFRRHSDFPLEHVATFRWVPGVAWSDHLSFWRQGYRALMVTDTAFYRRTSWPTRSSAARPKGCAAASLSSPASRWTSSHLAARSGDRDLRRHRNDADEARPSGDQSCRPWLIMLSWTAGSSRSNRMRTASFRSTFCPMISSKARISPSLSCPMSAPPHSASRVIIETPSCLIADLIIRGNAQEWRSMHHTMHGTAFDFPPNPFLQIRVEDESQVHFRDVVLWYQRRI